MRLIFQGHDYRYAVEQSLLAFFPGQRPVYEGEEADRALVSLTLEGREALAETVLTVDGRTARGQARTAIPDGADEYEGERLRQRAVKLSFFEAARALTGVTPAWGALTGIRPAKLASELLEAGGPEAADRTLRDVYFVSPQRRRLCIECAQAGLAARAALKPEEISLYVGIPFCPTRCAYCSFVSNSVEKSLHLVEPYLQALLAEIDSAGRMVEELGLRIRSFYMGGGTPTTLSADQMSRLLDRLQERFDLSGAVELTVEAGRPDTITEEKLAALRRGGVTRISVNPQTLNDRVLEAVGRRHTAEDFFRAYQLAKTFPFTAVNIDLIAGLTGDTLDSFRHTLEQAIALAPENITVHALTMKRAADMIGEKVQRLGEISQVGAMVDHSQAALAQAGYQPYYLYRQKSTVDSLENVGFCKGDTPCLYNIYIMDETHTILSAGGGGVTKVVLPGNRIERLFNYKYPYEYISRFPTILERKDALKNFPL